nr:hypothetical protein BaRGS_026141 [Batillaria attramentaria]
MASAKGAQFTSSLLFEKAFVDGKWVTAKSGKTFEVPDMDATDTRQAIEVAFKAFQQWRETTAKGKPLQDAQGEVGYGTGFMEWFGEEARRAYGDIVPSPFKNKRILIMKQPIGVCGMITPLAEQAGLPPGVLNVVTSSRSNAAAVGKELCENPIVKKISFTGSTNVGKILLQQSASTVKKVSLELGGNAPFIVFDSADVEAAVTGAMACKFRCSGQTCVCANRFLVQEGIYDRFVKRLAEVMNADLRIGDGMDPATTQGPLINKAAVEKVDGLVKDAVTKGAKVVLGGQIDAKGDNFYQPTLLTDITGGMRCFQEEIFGPVAACVK